MTQTAIQQPHDLNRQQRDNGRKTVLKILARHRNGDILKVGKEVITPIRHLLASEYITKDQADALEFYQAQMARAEDRQAVIMKKIRVDGGKQDLGEKIIRKVAAEKLVRESREQLPPTIMVNGQLEHPRAAYEALLADPEISFRALGMIYRPSVTSRNKQAGHGKWAIKFAGERIEAQYIRHRLGMV
ncbi:MAG: hypothetical protein GY938_02370 [Ketobacter sp.]|nr:hypothetical protein [Ketobacter sp.]